MKTVLLKILFFSLAFTACTSTRISCQSANDNLLNSAVPDEPPIAADQKPSSLMDLPQTENGGFVLKPGFYEAEFKTYCLQPGTPDPHQGDAYLQGPMSGHRKEIVESILLHSRDHQDMDQRNIQLLLWAVVSGSDFNSLSYEVQNDARVLLTPKQIFELQGGVMGVIRNVSSSTGLLNANDDIRRLFQTSVNSYEAYERIAVLQEQSKVIKKSAKYDQWYRQKENYYVRYFPESYKKVRIQLYVPDGLLDSSNKRNNEYLVYDPTGQQAIPAFTNAQRLGIGAPMINILREIIRINRPPAPPKKVSKKTDNSSL
ncbi:MAG: hypothetical protein ACJ75B_17375 [Flavisolibacter sp.]